ncbi:AAA family ATPase [Nocardioides sp. Kera G14]|uniref:AAA family ATPase n=1 Tax=Nocardioides sp. Kera G14 TaxID=2884264 RepID=UPI001D11BB24|nr:AAA family ATPase [Nocardioides sp. Kera G14]UDY23761.1 AAA family ATPase [Nocardioides sp. Kera G14]
MTTIVLGATDQAVVSELRRALNEVPDADIAGIGESTPEVSALAMRLQAEVVILHDALGPESAPDVVRDIVSRTPATAVLVVNSSGDVASALATMEAGAKGVISWPMLHEDIVSKVTAAAEWSGRMGSLLSGATVDTERELGRHGRVTAFTGAKGGVGTTTVATHLALDLKRRVPGTKVCIVDLDLQAGDVAGILEARQRVSIADVAKVAEDLSPATVLDALVEHESGVSLLLAPPQVADSEFVTPTSVRAILGMLRREFDAIIVDGGAHVTPAQAAAVEIADEAIVLVTPDVLAMRAFRRAVTDWEGLGVRTEADLRVLVNRVSRDDVLNVDAIAKLTSAPLVSTSLPAMFRRLERGVNARNPEEVRESVWWDALEKIGAEIGVVTAAQPPAAVGSEPGRRRSAARPARSARGGRRNRDKQGGQAAVETVAVMPLVLVIVLLVWQLGLTAFTFTWADHASNVAARTYSMGASDAEVREAARDAAPSGWGSRVDVSIAGGTVTVSTQVPLLCLRCGALPASISQSTKVVQEP